MLVKLVVVNTYKQEITLYCEEDDMIETLLHNHYPKKPDLHIYLCSKSFCRLIDRKEIVKDVLKECILMEEDTMYKLVNVNEYIDVYINAHTRNLLKTTKNKERIFVNEETQIEAVEKELKCLFDTPGNLYGLYGFYSKNDIVKVFKLKKNCNVMFAKRCFTDTNFFQYQINENYESLHVIKPTYEGLFYRMDYNEQKLLFKKTHGYSLRDNTLCKLKNEQITDCFYRIDKAKVIYEKINNKNYIKIQNDEKSWILCTSDAKNCQNMYNALICAAKSRVTREIETEKSLVKDVQKEQKQALKEEKKICETELVNKKEIEDKTKSKESIRKKNSMPNTSKPGQRNKNRKNVNKIQSGTCIDNQNLLQFEKDKYYKEFLENTYGNNK